MEKDKWIKRWAIPSSTGSQVWIVAVDADGNYGCSCPVWKFRRQECHHIKQVKAGGDGLIDPKAIRPKYVLAKVRKPRVEDGKLLVPLVAIPDAHMMEATICYYMLENGYSLGEIREMRHVPREWTVKAIYAHIKLHGEAEYPEVWYPQ